MYWVTFNEATTVYAWMTYGTGQWPPQKRSVKDFLKFRKGVLRAHRQTYREIKAMCHDRCRVGVVENNRALIGPLLMLKSVGDRLYSHWLWRRVRKECDFIGLNYYTTRRMSGQPGRIAREMNWEVWPEGIYHAIKNAAKFKKPIFITENGIADKTDRMREDFIREHVSWVAQAMRDGVDVRGYLYWSLLDNFEWAEGFAPRFGLVAVDYETQKRTIRSSAYAYAKMIQDNVVDLPGGDGTVARRDSRRHR